MELGEAFKKIEPFIAIAVLITLIILGVLLYQDNVLKKEVSESCGWGEEDYYCYCEWSDVMEYKNKYGEIEIDVELDR